MKKLLWLALIVFASQAQAAQLAVKFTSPAEGDTTGLCFNPVLRPLASGQYVHVRIVRLAREDSLLVPFPGTIATVTFVGVPADTYAVRAWASIAAAPQFVGCDTVATLFTGFRPWKPKLTP